MRAVIAISITVLVGSAAPALSGPGLPPPGSRPRPTRSIPLVPPVDGTIVRRFAAPGTDWGPGHRGVDFSGAPGASVRAAASGEVTFAGPVGDLRAVAIAHGGNIETTYSSLDELYVARGDYVSAGTWIGTVGASHPGGSGGLHFAVKQLGRYVDPELHLGPLDLAGAIYLVRDYPIDPDEPSRRYIPRWLDDGSRDCTPLQSMPAGAPPPNRNVAVVVAGFNSNGADPVFHVPARLGYAPRDVYRFSYRGLDGPRLFEPYARVHTYGDLTLQTFALRQLLVEVRRRHPGRDVDLFAHSQGGLIARDAIQSLVTEWDPEVPRIAHLVTYATPHEGTRLADAPDVVDDGDAGVLLLDALERAGLDPWADSVDQMRPGSAYIDDLGRADVTLGTRALALSIPNDFIVPAHRAVWEGESSRTVPASGGVAGHSAITRSAPADGMAYAFLRDAPVSCDVADGAAAGRLISAGHRLAPWLLRWGEKSATRALSRTPLGRAVVTIATAVASARR